MSETAAVTKKEDRCFGGTNLTLDIMAGCNIMLVRKDGPYSKIVKVHIFTPLKFKGTCKISNGDEFEYEAEVSPSDQIDSMSSFPKIMTPELQDHLQQIFQEQTLESNKEFEGMYVNGPRPTKLAIAGDLSIHCLTEKKI